MDSISVRQKETRESERRYVTVMFADISGFISMGERWTSSGTWNSWRR